MLDTEPVPSTKTTALVICSDILVGHLVMLFKRSHEGAEFGAVRPKPYNKHILLQMVEAHLIVCFLMQVPGFSITIIYPKEGSC